MVTSSPSKLTVCDSQAFTRSQNCSVFNSLRGFRLAFNMMSLEIGGSAFLMFVLDLSRNHYHPIANALRLICFGL